MRIQFERGEQRKFLEEVCNKLNKSLREINSDFKKESSVSYSTIKKYFREELTLPVKIADIFSQKSGIDWKKFRAKTIPSNWGSRKGGILGMQTLMKKYKNELKMWRSKGAKSSNKSKLKQIFIPQSNEKLAELVGVALGDGTLTKYFLRISGDPRFDTSYFNYISNLCEGLFGLKPTLRKERNRNLMYLTIYSANVCNFLNKLGLPFGDKIKNKAKIPEIFLRDLPLSIACLRGLIDTDGTVSKRANQLTLTFWSNNRILLNQVWKIGRKLDIFTFKEFEEIGTNSWPKIIKYFNLVGSSNLKNVIRFIKRYNDKVILYQKDVLKYYDKYENINMPFRLGP